MAGSGALVVPAEGVRERARRRQAGQAAAGLVEAQIGDQIQEEERRRSFVSWRGFGALPSVGSWRGWWRSWTGGNDVDLQLNDSQVRMRRVLYCYQ